MCLAILNVKLVFVCLQIMYKDLVQTTKKKWSQEALAYNALVLGWPEITRLAREGVRPQATQAALFEEE